MLSSPEPEPDPDPTKEFYEGLIRIQQKKKHDEKLKDNLWK